MLLTVDLGLSDIDPQLICDMDHFPHGCSADSICILAFLKGAKGDTEYGARHIFCYVAHKFKPDPPDHIGIDLIVDTAAVKQLLYRQYIFGKLFRIIFSISEMDRSGVRIEICLSILHNDADPHKGIQNVFHTISVSGQLFAFHPVQNRKEDRIRSNLIFDILKRLQKIVSLHRNDDEIGGFLLCVRCNNRKTVVDPIYGNSPLLKTILSVALCHNTESGAELLREPRGKKNAHGAEADKGDTVDLFHNLYILPSVKDYKKYCIIRSRVCQ